MNEFSKIDRESLAHRKEFAETIGEPELFSVIDQFGLYAGVNIIGTELVVCFLSFVSRNSILAFRMHKTQIGELAYD